jgi:hypothetical protein
LKENIYYGFERTKTFFFWETKMLNKNFYINDSSKCY